MEGNGTAGAVPRLLKFGPDCSYADITALASARLQTRRKHRLALQCLLHRLPPARLNAEASPSMTGAPSIRTVNFSLVVTPICCAFNPYFTALSSIARTFVGSQVTRTRDASSANSTHSAGSPAEIRSISTPKPFGERQLCDGHGDSALGHVARRFHQPLAASACSNSCRAFSAFRSSSGGAPHSSPSTCTAYSEEPNSFCSSPLCAFCPGVSSTIARPAPAALAGTALVTSCRMPTMPSVGVG